MSEAVLPTYAVEGIQAGDVRPGSGLVRANGFHAMLIDEQALDIDVPALDFNVVVSMLGRRRDVLTSLGGRKSIQYSYGDQLVMPAGTPGRFATRGADAHRVLHLHFPSEAVPAFFHDDCDGSQIAPAAQSNDPLLRSAMLRLAEAIGGPLKPTDLYLQSLFVVIAGQLAGAPGAESAPRRGGLAPWQLKRAHDYIVAHLTEDVGLVELAALVDLSPKHFARAFKQSTGTPPHQFLLQQRIARAKELLARHDGGSISEIALACGFADQSHFTAAFRKATGQPPGAYRREALE